MTRSLCSSQWVIFDADNTLWDTESLYDQARSQYCAYVECILREADPDTSLRAADIALLQRQCDIELHATLGYSATRFAKSFEDTLASLHPSARRDELEQAKNIALRVFDGMPKLSKDLEATLLGLRSRYSLGIVTAGEQWVQQKRLSAFSLRGYFDDIVIVERKCSTTFDSFCVSHGVARSVSWVVGDSLKSDILPAIEAGLRAIHYDAPNWSVEHGVLPEGVFRADGMRDVLQIIGAARCV